MGHMWSSYVGGDFGWSSAIVAAIIAAAAAIVGGLLGYFATRNVEIMRLKAGLVEKAQERRLAALETFLLSVNDWVDWLGFIQEQGFEGRGEELTRRVKQRDDAFRRLMLLASDPLYEWLSQEYAPLEYELKRTYAHQVRWGRKPDDEAIAARRRFSRLLREDLMRLFRPEVAALRDPTHEPRRKVSAKLQAGWGRIESAKR